MALTTGVMAACSEVQVEHPTPAPSPSAVVTLPPIGFNHRYGNSPVTSADAFQLERSLYAQKEFWETAIATEPLRAGYVDRTDLARVAAARPAMTSLTAVIASESLPTIRGFIANGDSGQQDYCIHLLEMIRGLGYTGLTKATLLVYFGESDHHASLTWTSAGGYKYAIYDNDLKGTAVNPTGASAPSATFFPAFPSASP